MDNPNEPMYQEVRVAECKEATELVDFPKGVFRTANARDDSQGYCRNEETTIIWNDSPPTKARSEALISATHIAVPELRMLSAISQDMRRTEMEAVT
ncbi:hypothetical protein B9Z55_000270 [Caenorhabditis nigoni]|nr:hypothetical protein B9Z55_000270 [Caenorhabditis nigoni]